ncbi:MAG TPA: FlgO family outer membrane protein, partial [Blastocatellia bacterium]|nr:FlgO family outer membrane protein [Blastocatellia bacterium]
NFMSPESSSEVKFEIGHVLFIDIVGYSKLLINEQSEQIQTLREIVRGTEQFCLAEAERKLVRLPTGDGGALVFQTTPEAPVLCALEISKELKKHPELRVRMGIHSGPVNAVTDLNEQSNIAGAGINIAQRVMDCGDAGHILLSKHVAEDLEHYPRWQPYLHDLGEWEVKHGVRVSVVNLYGNDAGNAALPTRLAAQKRSSATGKRSASFRTLLVAAAILIGLGVPALIFTPAILKSLRSSTGFDKGAPSSIPEKSIAVLPFENLSDDKQNAFFADGVQDEVLTNLAKVADLKVISRTSVAQYKAEAARNLQDIGRALGVAHVLEGSVQRIANKVRVNAQLIDARSDAHLWAQTYTRDLADVFGIQTEIAEAIAQQLQARLSPKEKAQIAKPVTTDPVAYDLYLRARQLDDLVNDPDAKGSLLQGISLLEEAVRRDPKFLRAYCLMCQTHLDLYWAGFDHTDQRREMARVALQKAEEIQPDAGEVHWMKGLYAYHGFRDYDRALTELKLATQLLPNEARLYVVIGAIDRRTGRWQEAETNFKRAVELDPRNFIVVGEAASTFQGMRRYPEAGRLYEQALSILPNDPFVSFLFGFNSFAQTGETAEWQKPLQLIAQQGPQAARGVAFPLLVCSWVQRDQSESEKALALIPAEGIANSFDEASIPREYCVGRTAWLFGNKELAQSALTAARAIFERMTREQPDYAQGWSYLGLTDAMLGRCDQAIQEGKRACEVLPFTKDSWVGPIWITHLAAIYTLCGDKDAALEQLEKSVNLPVGVSYGELKQSPDWDSLRGDPRFEKIVASLAPKEPPK